MFSLILRVVINRGLLIWESFLSSWLGAATKVKRSSRNVYANSGEVLVSGETYLSQSQAFQDVFVQLRVKHKNLSTYFGDWGWAPRKHQQYHSSRKTRLARFVD